MKWLIIIAIVILAFWYFQPAMFNNYLNTAKDKIGWNKDSAPATTTTTNQQIAEQNRTAIIPRTSATFDGYCAINGRCEFVASSQCTDMLYTNRSACEQDLGIADAEVTGHTYYGRPNTAAGTPYDCKTDTDCRFDLPGCRDLYCQCEYSTGRCYT